MSIYNIDVISRCAYVPRGKALEDLIELSQKYAVNADDLSHIVAKNVLAGKKYADVLETISAKLANGEIT
ncbi:hypothetical protein M0R72_17340 [Candidatus Pacearchaeota archaeon]|jgi:hypothetical protein|nr:hypothetical protein [Candidatus Pacearchaeota archaeon]